MATDRALFAEKVQQFAEVVEALLQSEATRIALAKAPLATLQKYGIDFPDKTVAKMVDSQLGEMAGMYQPDPDHPFPVTAPACLTWVANPRDIRDAITIDPGRVDAFVSHAALQIKFNALEKKVAMFESALAMR